MGYLVLDGDLVAGPLFPPAFPGIFDVSVDVAEFTSDPVVPNCFGAGPLLLPAWPGMPAPELGVVGVKDRRSEAPELVVCAIAASGSAAMKSANVPATKFRIVALHD